ncbi:hypothetical protein JCGZ_16053 [Jatropha curcas]|uniref:Syntaxin 6/10/61 N-terminal domain-containing protein n=1 Tax=Jatropha curcas TaxID=180498 RepID=A0A067KZL8_JATCU|nr:hypothetical protein JCGZ_16053 [Jatropha curcas]
MATSFDRWEKDPFFPAAEEVQESADRMESTYRTWVHAMKDASSMWNSEELRRDLHTALGTTKWQLEEFLRAVRLSYVKSFNEDSRDRHYEFMVAIEAKISKIEDSLQEYALLEGKPSSPWVELDEGECNELELFLAGPSASGDQTTIKNHSSDSENQQRTGKELNTGCLRNLDQSVEWNSLEARDEKFHRHRRTASAVADIGAWNIDIAEVSCQENCSNGQSPQTLQKVPSVSGFSSSLECPSNLTRPKNGIRKCKAMDSNQESDTAALRSSQLTRGIHVCYEKSKSCLNGCDECYDKQLYGWYGVIQRQLQRSQYQMQYGRPVKVVMWIALLFCLIVEYATWQCYNHGIRMRGVYLEKKVLLIL